METSVKILVFSKYSRNRVKFNLLDFANWEWNFLTRKLLSSYLKHYCYFNINGTCLQHDDNKLWFYNGSFKKKLSQSATYSFKYFYTHEVPHLGVVTLNQSHRRIIILKVKNRSHKTSRPCTIHVRKFDLGQSSNHYRLVSLTQTDSTVKA